jgi:hypothetical protein
MPTAETTIALAEGKFIAFNFLCPTQLLKNEMMLCGGIHQSLLRLDS